MENSKLEMLSSMVTSALAKIIDENSTTTDYKSLTVEDIQNWFNYQASNEDVQNIDIHCFYDILHDSVLEEITARYLRELKEQCRIGEFIENCNLNNIIKLPSENTSDLLNSIYETCFDEFDEFVKNKHYGDMENLEVDDIPDNIQNDIIDNWFDNIADSDDILDKCSSYLENNLKEHFSDEISEELEEVFKDRAKDAIENM